MVFTLGVCNVEECHSYLAGLRTPLARYESHTSGDPPAGLLVSACRQIVAKHAPERMSALMWRNDLVLNCRCFYEELSYVRQQPDWGHCGMHPANVAWRLAAEPKWQWWPDPTQRAYMLIRGQTPPLRIILQSTYHHPIGKASFGGGWVGWWVGRQVDRLVQGVW